MASKEIALRIERLRQAWAYDPVMGTFTRLEKPKRGTAPNEQGSITPNGYRVLSVDSKSYLAQRLAWFLVTSVWAEGEIKFRNGNTLDLRWDNLFLRPKNLKQTTPRSALTAERLRELMEYAPATGRLTWKVKTPRGQIGEEVGVITNTGYRITSVDGHKHLAHRLAWLHVHGEWPMHQVDHVNGDRADNRIANLRDATPSQNAHNAVRRNTNVSGFKGVSPTKGGKWHARIVINYQTIPLGNFNTPEEAHAAYCAAAKKYHGDFANHGGPTEPLAPKEA